MKYSKDIWQTNEYLFIFDWFIILKNLCVNIWCWQLMICNIDISDKAHKYIDTYYIKPYIYKLCHVRQWNIFRKVRIAESPLSNLILVTIAQRRIIIIFVLIAWFELR